MQVIGWITIILLYLVALTFIVTIVGPIIHAELSLWYEKKDRYLAEKEEDSKFKDDLKKKRRELKTYGVLAKDPTLAVESKKSSSIDDIGINYSLNEDASDAEIIKTSVEKQLTQMYNTQSKTEEKTEISPVIKLDTTSNQSDDNLILKANASAENKTRRLKANRK